MAESFREEITRLEALHAGDPGSRVFTHLAEAYRKAGELSRARDLLDHGMRDHGEYASAYVVLGRVLMDMGHPDEARAAFQRVLELDRHNVVALRSLGDLAIVANDTDAGLRHYRELLALDPDDEPAQATVARLESSVPAAAAAAAGTNAGSGANVEPEVPGDAAADVGDDTVTEPDEMVTETMAELYAAQGLHARAAEVYRSLLRARPGAERLVRRLREMESLIDGSKDGPASAAIPPAAAYAAASAFDEMPGWLEHVESAWTGGSGVAGARPTPYAWTEMVHTARADEAADERPISAYFQGLLAWRPGAGVPPGHEAPGGVGGTVEEDEDLEMFRSWLQSLKT